MHVDVTCCRSAEELIYVVRLKSFSRGTYKRFCRGVK